MKCDTHLELVAPSTSILEHLSQQLATFEQNLLATDVYTVLERAGEYVAKRDLLTAFEEAKLTTRELTALVTVPDLLDKFYSHWAHRNDLSSDMPDLTKAIKSYAHQRTKEKQYAR